MDGTVTWMHNSWMLKWAHLGTCTLGPGNIHAQKGKTNGREAHVRPNALCTPELSPVLLCSAHGLFGWLPKSGHPEEMSLASLRPSLAILLALRGWPSPPLIHQGMGFHHVDQATRPQVPVPFARNHNSWGLQGACVRPYASCHSTPHSLTRLEALGTHVSPNAL